MPINISTYFISRRHPNLQDLGKLISEDVEEMLRSDLELERRRKDLRSYVPTQTSVHDFVSRDMMIDSGR